MFDELTARILKRLEAFPDATFRESELTAISKKLFDSLVKKETLVFDRYDKNGSSYFSDHMGDADNERILRINGDKISAFSGDPEVATIQLTKPEITYYRFVWDGLTQSIRSKNALYKNNAGVTERIHFIGAKDILRQRVGIYLGLFGDEREATDELLGLRSKTDPYHRYYVLCPTYEIKSQDLLSRLPGEGITCLPFKECLARDCAIDFSKLKDKKLATARTNEQILEATDHDYNCQDRLHIPGTCSRKKSNAIEVNDSKISIGDSLFRLLVQLVIGAKKNAKKGGWVYFDTSTGKYQQYSNLRAPLKGALIKKDAANFIENDGQKNYRLSIPPDHITFNRNALLKHPDPTIKGLAKKLPAKKIKKEGA